jgi:hypothetical protein
MKISSIKGKYAHYKARKELVATVKGWNSGLDEKRKLTKEQKKEIRDYYYRLTGQKISLLSHEYFYF